jgi:hypothetical protein
MVMETILTTRKKYNVDKKITIKYYLREIKNTENGLGYSRYSLYILLTVDSKVTKFKSKISYDTYLKQEDVKIEQKNLLSHTEEIKREKAVIECIVRELKPFDKENFDIKKVSEIYNNPRWFLWNAINDYLYLELFETNYSMMIPMRFSVHPKSFLDYSENVKIKEIGSKFKSKIFSFDMILWALSQNNDYGFLNYPPTIIDVSLNIVNEAIMSKNFQALEPNSKDVFLSELKELLWKNKDNFFV